MVGSAWIGLSVALPSTPAGATPSSSHPPTVSPAETTVVVSRTLAPIGGQGATVTVTLKSAAGVPVPGKLVTLSTSGGHAAVSSLSDSTDSNGHAWFEVTDSRVETVTFSALDRSDGLSVSGHPCVTFGGQPPAQTPEAPVTLALPLIAAGIVGITLRARRPRSESNV